MLGKYLVIVQCPTDQGEKLHIPATNLGTICGNPKTEILELLKRRQNDF
jgi:hypothetical protein